MLRTKLSPLLAELSAVEQERILRATEQTVAAIGKILLGAKPSVYLCGSAVLGDLRADLSDIDLLVLTQTPITEEQAESLVHLRQVLTESDAANPWYRRLEGGMLSWTAFCRNSTDRVVYWGTSGERITDRYRFDSFSKQILLRHGLLLLGEDARNRLSPPVADELRADVRAHYETIRRYAKETSRSVYSFGWLADIARGLYTLRTGGVISKTQAMRWALEQGLCPVAGKLAVALIVRRNPRAFDESIALGDMAEGLGKDVQAFANVLQKELENI